MSGTSSSLTRLLTVGMCVGVAVIIGCRREIETAWEEREAAFIDTSGTVVPAPFPEWWQAHIDGVQSGRRWETHGRLVGVDEFSDLVNTYLALGEKPGDEFYPHLLTPIPPLVWGYYDRQGYCRCTVQCMLALSFSEGRAAVWLEEDGKDRWAFIDLNGKVVIDGGFIIVEAFSEGLAAVQVPGVHPTIEIGDALVVVDEPLWGYVDTEGKMVIRPRFAIAGSFKGGLAPVCMRMGAGLPDRVGFIDKSGELVLENAEWGGVGEFGEGLAPASFRPRKRPLFAPDPGSLWGYVDRHGRFRILPQFSDAQPFSEGLAAVQVGGKWGFINKTGEIVIKPQFDYVDRFRQGHAVVWLKKRKSRG